MFVLEWGHGRREEVTHAADVDALLDQATSQARSAGRPQDVQVTVDGAGTLGIVVGAEWSLLSHIPPHLDPPYMVSVGHDSSEDPVVFYVSGDHYSEALRRNTISPETARSAIRHFVSTGELSGEVEWEET
jgi:hypothetical protein